MSQGAESRDVRERWSHWQRRLVWLFILPAAASASRSVAARTLAVPFALLWSLELLDHSKYVRQELDITGVDKDAAVKLVELIDLPLTQSKVTHGRTTAWIDRDLPLQAGQYAATSPWHEDAGKSELLLSAGEAHAFRLTPIAVPTLDVVPRP